MFPTWRIQLREARLAWRQGRYDEAGRLLAAETLRDFRPARVLARSVAGKIVERAGIRLANGDSLAGWQDVATADRLGGQGEAINRLRREYVEHGLVEAVRYLGAGEPRAALRCLAKLERHALMNELARRLKQIGLLMQEAQAASARGHFVEAGATIGKARQLATSEEAPAGSPQELRVSTMEIVNRLDGEGERIGAAAGEAQRFGAEMHQALGAEDWSRVLSSAEGLLALAPQHLAASQARQKAWRAVGMSVTQPYLGRRANRQVSLQVDRGAGRGGAKRSTRPSVRSSEIDTVVGKEPCERALLWVDAVGGYLVCLDDVIVIGQPASGESIAVPILADLSRRHAVIRREGGQYVIEPLQSVRVDGRELRGAHVLSDKELIELGESVRLRFSKPHALSATAKLSIESHHKTQPSADFILLMADSCVLGPNKHCHVRSRDWESDVILYRDGERLFCRSEKALSTDGVFSEGAIELCSGARIEGDDFAFTWEALD